MKKNAEYLYEKYEKADLKNFQEFMLSFVKQNDYILELGFGSGREIDFFLKNGFENIYGIDGSKVFVKKVQKRFGSDHFYYSVLPEIDISEYLRFDFIYSLAVWMHLPTQVYEKSADNIAGLLKDNGMVLLSFSLEERKEEKRYFQKVDEALLERVFKKYGIEKTDEIITADALNRCIKWKSVLYKKQKF